MWLCSGGYATYSLQKNYRIISDISPVLKVVSVVLGGLGMPVARSQHAALSQHKHHERVPGG